MTIPRTTNAAYAGTHDNKITVLYITRDTATHERKLGLGHTRAGWYWTHQRAPQARHGPFTSSQAAYRDAVFSLLAHP